jgi:protein phosphatase
MGGHNGGDVAARLAVAGVTDYIRAPYREGTWPVGFDQSLSTSSNMLRSAVHVANRQILEAASSRRALSGMGTTIVAALVHGDTISIAHVGDSRLYLFAGGKLRLLTADDSWALNRNVLTNVLGSRPYVDVHVAEEKLSGGEVLALVTDGVHAAVDDEGIGEAMARGDQPAGIARRLVRAALHRGSRDNCTAVVAEYLA